jgi:predicted Zn-dependent peptidase
LNFQGAGQSSKDLVPLAVLSTLLGGGDSFSSGGPGKGMTSKLYENVLNRHHYVASALATHFMYGTTGMFTLKGSCDASFAGQLATVLAKELKELVDKVNPADLERARNATASIVLINNEHGAINAEDMGRQVHAPHFSRKIQTISPAIHLSNLTLHASQVMFTGGRTSPEQLLAQVNAVTAADIQCVQCAPSCESS